MITVAWAHRAFGAIGGPVASVRIRYSLLGLTGTRADYFLHACWRNRLSNRACEAVAVNPYDSNQIYLASVNGGVWKTYNAGYSRLNGWDDDFDGAVDEGDEMPSWEPLTDQLVSLSIGSIAFDPLDTTGQTVYAGVGGGKQLLHSARPLRRLVPDVGRWHELDRRRRRDVRGHRRRIRRAHKTNRHGGPDDPGGERDSTVSGVAPTPDKRGRGSRSPASPRTA